MFQGSVAYVAQIPFILNATVRNNILFGSEYNEEFYNSVIEACALTADLEMLPKNDKTMIGEKVSVLYYHIYYLHNTRNFGRREIQQQ